jgi:RND family efflux transporter MFP subunit|tara:strand:+ start:1894 stop:3030 length:1137 start_codon:yes stop_codon:yes gene_type:complete
MKNLFLILLVIGVASCSTEVVNTDRLSQLSSEKDSLINSKNDITAKLAEIELELSSLDTNKKFTLVRTEKPEVKRFDHYFTVHGIAQTDQNITINAQAQGQVDVIKVKEGDKVFKGQTIAVQNTDILKKNLNELETRLNLAQTVFERQEKLWKQKVGSEMQFLQAKNNRDALKNSMQTLQEQIEMANIIAPFAGIVDEVFAKEGELPNPGIGIIRLINLDKMYIEADVSEKMLSKINVGDKVNVRFPSIDYYVESTIKRMGNFINPNNRTFKMVVDVTNNNGNLKPNLLAEIDVIDFTADSAVVVPSNLLLQGSGGKNYVFVATNNNGVVEAVKKAVEIKMSFKQESLIASGIKANDNIISKGARSIKDGETVEISNN